MVSYRVAVGTLDGEAVTEHFGQATNFRIFEIHQSSGETTMLMDVAVPGSGGCNGGHDENMLQKKLQTLLDLKINVILVRAIGPGSERLCLKNGFEVLTSHKAVDDALKSICSFYRRYSFANDYSA